MANTTSTPKGKEENRTNPTLEKAKEFGSQAMDKAKDAASTVSHLAGEAASSVGHLASQAASSVGKTADNLAASAGTGIKNLGESLSQQAPREGMLGSASQTVANTLKDSGRYLEEAGLSGVADDVTQLIRRNPIPAILVGMGVGFLIGRAMRS